MMKMTLKEVNERMEGLNLLKEDISGKRFPSQISFAIIENMESLAERVNCFDEVRRELCKQYAQKKKDGTPMIESFDDGGHTKQRYVLREEDLKKFEEEYKRLELEEVEVRIRTISVSSVDQCDKDPRYDVFTVKNLNAIRFMLMN